MSYVLKQTSRKYGLEEDWEELNEIVAVFDSVDEDEIVKTIKEDLQGMEEHPDDPVDVYKDENGYEAWVRMGGVGEDWVYRFSLEKSDG